MYIFYIDSKPLYYIRSGHLWVPLMSRSRHLSPLKVGHLWMPLFEVTFRRIFFVLGHQHGNPEKKAGPNVFRLPDFFSEASPGMRNLTVFVCVCVRIFPDVRNCGGITMDNGNPNQIHEHIIT